MNRTRRRAEGAAARCTLTEIDPDVVVRGVALALGVHSRMSAEARRELPRGSPAPLAAFDEGAAGTPLLVDRDASYFTRPDHPADAADALPLANRLERFVRTVYEKICTEPEVPIIALILVERLVRVVGVGFVRRQTVRPLVASAFVLACKVGQAGRARPEAPAELHAAPLIPSSRLAPSHLSECTSPHLSLPADLVRRPHAHCRLLRAGLRGRPRLAAPAGLVRARAALPHRL